MSEEAARAVLEAAGYTIQSPEEACLGAEKARLLTDKLESEKIKVILLQHLWYLDSKKKSIIYNHLTEKLYANEKLLRLKTAEVQALRCALLATAFSSAQCSREEF
jgi:hypothetical protein